MCISCITKNVRMKQSLIVAAAIQKLKIPDSGRQMKTGV